MAKTIGAVDELGRPVVRIEVPDFDGFLAVVDTGFNRSLLLPAAQAKAMGFTITEDSEVVELGTSARTKLRRGYGSISWLDRTVQVETYISDEPAAISRPDAARALIGTELLADCLLLVDFRAKVVEVETQD